MSMRVVGTSVLCVLLASGCRSGFSESACPGEAFSLTSAMLGSFDFAELRETEGARGGAPPRVVETAGIKCKGAKDAPACEAKVAAATASSGFTNGSHGRMPGYRYLVVTRGDDVTVIDGKTKTLGAALAPVDSPAKAAAAASVERSIAPSCKGSVRRVPGAFEVHLASSSCLGPVDEVLKVSPDGRVEVVSSEHGKSTCVGAADIAPAPPAI